MYNNVEIHIVLEATNAILVINVLHHNTAKHKTISVNSFFHFHSLLIIALDLNILNLNMIFFLNKLNIMEMKIVG